MQIAFFGATNSGKSSLVNALAGQQVSLVSPLPGTTTDPVRKRIELPGLGACTLVDTAGYGDEGALGTERERLTRGVIDATDLAVLLRSGHPADDRWEDLLRTAEVPTVVVDRSGGRNGAGTPEGYTPWQAGELESLLGRIAEAAPREERRFLTGGLVKPGDTVLLVMPQDSEAPKGRIILPQVQVLRELLDRGCVPHCCTPESLPAAWTGLRAAPALVITDSQAFKTVNAAIPQEVPLTSFSVLLAGAKGDIRTFIRGAEAIDRLRPGDRVLIAEACTHVPDTEDIGRVKIPTLLQKKVSMAFRGGQVAAGGQALSAGASADGQALPALDEQAATGEASADGPDLPALDEQATSGEASADGQVVPALDEQATSGEASADGQAVPALDEQATSGEAGRLRIEIAAGNDFPEDLAPYRLIIHCGACVATAALVRSRMRKALLAGVPITNYGIALAHLHGILPRIALPE